MYDSLSAFPSVGVSDLTISMDLKSADLTIPVINIMYEDKESEIFLQNAPKRLRNGQIPKYTDFPVVVPAK